MNSDTVTPAQVPDGEPTPPHQQLRGFTPSTPQPQTGFIAPDQPAAVPTAPTPASMRPEPPSRLTNAQSAPPPLSAAEGPTPPSLTPPSLMASPEPGISPLQTSAPASQAQMPLAYESAHVSLGAAPQNLDALYAPPAFSEITTPAQPKRRKPLVIVSIILLILALLGALIFGFFALSRSSAFNVAPPSSHSVPDAPPITVDPKSPVPQWEAVAQAVSPSVVTINVTNGSTGGVGSGVIYHKDGLIITNHHVIADGQGSDGKIIVTLTDQRIYEAKIVGTDPSSDLAVIQLVNPPTDLKVASLGASSDLVVGQPVMAVGAPLGLSNTVTTGIISALNRPVEVAAKQSRNPEDPFGQLDPNGAQDTIITNAIQIDASINPGNSGGPLFNSQGQVIGINSSIASLSESGSDKAGSIGLGFAIPVDLVRSVADQLVDSGKVRHAVLGVVISNAYAEVGGTRHLGSLVKEITPNGAADQAGIRVDDVITHVDGTRTPSVKALQGTIRQYTAGSEVTITLYRDGETLEVRATLQALDKE